MLLSLLLFDALVLVGGKVHSMVPGEAAREATIVIENGRITVVGDPSSTPADARRIFLWMSRKCPRRKCISGA